MTGGGNCPSLTDQSAYIVPAGGGEGDEFFIHSASSLNGETTSTWTFTLPSDTAPGAATLIRSYTVAVSGRAQETVATSSI